MTIPMTIKRNTPTVVAERATPAPAVITPGEIMEQVLIKGDLKNLSEGERARYYTRVCESVKLNPLTKPFEYITLNGKLTLYARKDATDQLRTIHKVSVVESTQEELAEEKIYIVVTKVQNGEGRTDIARGAVSLAGLKGEALANQIMKCETKSKRRATLSICGLGFLDETEIEDIDAKSKRVVGRSADGRTTAYAAKNAGTDVIFNEIIAHVRAAPDLLFLDSLRNDYAQDLADLPTRWALLLSQEYEDKWKDLGGDPTECPLQAGEDRG